MKTSTLILIVLLAACGCSRKTPTSVPSGKSAVTGIGGFILGERLDPKFARSPSPDGGYDLLVLDFTNMPPYSSLMVSADEDRTIYDVNLSTSPGTIQPDLHTQSQLIELLETKYGKLDEFDNDAYKSLIFGTKDRRVRFVIWKRDQSLEIHYVDMPVRKKFEERREAFEKAKLKSAVTN